MHNYIGNMFMISAPSGAGKSSLIQALLKDNPNIKLSISCTTRKPRPGEQNGREYYFLEEEEFFKLRDENNLLEWAKVHGHYYGTPKPPIDECLAKGEDILLEIDYQGAKQVRNIYPDITSIFILPPSIEELEKRLRNRAQDSEDVIKQRLFAARHEIEHANECEYVIINNEFNTALKELQSIFSAARLTYEKQRLRHEKLFDSFTI
ncbi:guanylate kinase [Basilea psittacipulmonis]|nr:guanylate kinase [Basilea psittacipulmonis]